MIPTPEFSRPVRANTLSASPRTLEIGANAQERAALALRFGLEAIERLTAQAWLSRSGETVTAAGTLSARVTQSCVATGEPVNASVEEPFTIHFRPHPEEKREEEEIELGEGELDVIFYDGGWVDLGEAVAETLSLSLDPYPRAPGAERTLRAAGVLSEEEARPASALAGLKDLLGRKS